NQSGPQLGPRIAPLPCKVCAFELIGVNRKDGIGFLWEPFTSSRRLKNNQQGDREQDQYGKHAEVKLSQLLFINLAGELSQLCLMFQLQIYGLFATMRLRQEMRCIRRSDRLFSQMPSDVQVRRIF